MASGVESSDSSLMYDTQCSSQQMPITHFPHSHQSSLCSLHLRVSYGLPPSLFISFPFIFPFPVIVLSFSNSIYEWNHVISVFLWLISLNIIPSGSIHVVANGKSSFFFYYQVVSHCIYITWERAREGAGMQVGERQRARERESPKQALRCQHRSLTRGSILQIVRSWLEHKSRVGHSADCATQAPPILHFWDSSMLFMFTVGGYSDVWIHCI